MLLQLLEPTIQNQVVEVFDQIAVDNDMYMKFMTVLALMEKDKPGLSKELLFQMENIFILTVKQTVEISYRAGISDGLKLRS